MIKTLDLKRRFSLRSSTSLRRPGRPKTAQDSTESSIASSQDSVGPSFAATGIAAVFAVPPTGLPRRFRRHSTSTRHTPDRFTLGEVEEVAPSEGAEAASSAATRPVAVHVYPDGARCTHPFRDLQDPTSPHKVPSLGLRYRLEEGPALSDEEEERLRDDLTRQIMHQQPDAYRPQYAFHSSLDGRRHVDLIFPRPSAFEQARKLVLTHHDRPLPLVATGSPLSKYLHVLKLTNLTGFCQYSTLFAVLTASLEPYFRIDHMWGMYQLRSRDNRREFDGQVTILGHYQHGCGPRNLPGWINYQSVDCKLWYDGRPDWCTYCKIRGPARPHLNSECTQRLLCTVCNEWGHPPTKCVLVAASTNAPESRR
ncbi:uncharacterized protein PFL1_00786 [Pseudozyma flocculosa PF-1]|uniref:Uncharacterized protein n=1 Tax=Pseudozyma flocculosa TaxID=84751 RepID=A0A5C3F4A4_9BASI|nr:uncharacterized protein PFL1_00786 [Pseudozyma flocculosa PF-1]EPQ31451.1 hypothetical protein PFL1_00786 [Pseudozyma flocculosa PF-1]SPO38766.1 uncharacterized protein PSFLO_04245 [Pseudozyma flocculosa]